VDEGGEEAVDRDGVRQPQGVRDGGGVFGSPAQVGGVDAVFVGEEGVPGGVEGVVVVGGAGAGVGLEPVEDSPPVEVE
jgi:hypothetical protein